MATVNLTCRIGRASSTFTVPANFSGTPHFIRSTFRTGSRDVINLVPDNRTAGAPLLSHNPSKVDAVDLHRCLAKLTGNTPGAGPVGRIGLVLADRYNWGSSVLGVMFDRGFPTADDPNDNDAFVGTPREGCAIFIGAIADARTSALDFAKEVEFTTIHELGHVFNLRHRDGCFMETSPRNKPHDNSRFKFHSGQKDWLEECDINPRVKPGGSRFDPVLALNQPVGHPMRSSMTKLVLEIGVGNPEFACSSPVELDVTLRVGVPGKHRFYVSDRIDPGYDEFNIWITRPDGERRLFRSQRNYCARPARVLVTDQRPFQRDISLFESATGTTFGNPGLYTIQAEFNLGRRGILLSNAVTVEAITDKRMMPTERVSLLTDPTVRRFLYHRSFKTGGDVPDRLEKHLKSDPGGSGADGIHYALARALANKEKRLSKSETHQLIAHLRAMQGPIPTLGHRQLQHVLSLIKDFGR